MSIILRASLIIIFQPLSTLTVHMSSLLYSLTPLYNNNWYDVKLWNILLQAYEQQFKGKVVELIWYESSRGLK